MRQDSDDRKTGRPRINPDGNYGDETVRAVENAQRFFGIPITGVVDLETWTLLFADFE